MSQNIYDDAEFFSGYSRLARSVEGLDGAAEWPALRAMLPSLEGKRVLDLGCGFGWFCRWARTQGAASVSGLDVSERMLARARTDTSDVAITYARADLETVELARGSFDVAYSSLTLHYLSDLDRLLREVHEALTAHGTFVCSVEHPIFTAPTAPGWVFDETGRRTWPVDRYLDEGPRTRNWLVDGVVKHHRTVATHVNALVHAGFAVGHVEEWGPSDEQIRDHPEWRAERDRPMFLLIAAQRL